MKINKKSIKSSEILKQELIYIKKTHLDSIVATLAGITFGMAAAQSFPHPQEALLPITLVYGGMCNFVTQPKTTLNYALNLSYFALAYYSGLNFI